LLPASGIVSADTSLLYDWLKPLEAARWLL
jgi:hypothetical protein